MEGKYKFDEGKYTNTFDTMFGKGAFNAGLLEAALLGRSSAEAQFAEQMYVERLKAAEAAARSRRSRGRSSRSGGSGDSGSRSSNELVNQFRAEKAQSNKSNLDRYYESESARLNEGRSVAKKKVEELYPNVIPTVRDNPNLSAWQKMKLFGG